MVLKDIPMKRLDTIFSISTALWAIISCTSQEPLCPPTDVEGVFHASIAESGSTKTFIDGMSINWQDHDCVRINGAEYEAEVITSNPTHATFSLVNGTPSKEGELNKAIFPSSLYKATPTPHYELPSEFEYNSGRYDIPMYAESKTQNLVFNSIFATLKVCLPTDYVVKSLTVTSDCPLNGKFTINTSNLDHVNYVQAEMQDSDPYRGNMTTTVKFSPEIIGGDVYLPIPAGLYAGKNLKFMITCRDGIKYEMTTNQSSPISILAGTLYTFNFRRDGQFDAIEDTTIGYSDIL